MITNLLLYSIFHLLKFLNWDKGHLFWERDHLHRNWENIVTFKELGMSLCIGEGFYYWGLGKTLYIGDVSITPI